MGNNIKGNVEYMGLIINCSGTHIDNLSIVYVSLELLISKT